MEFDEHEEQDDEMEIQMPENSQALGDSGTGREKVGGEEGASTGTRKSGGGATYRYKECMKNHAVSNGGHAVDGCGEFMPAGEEGTLEALRCAACNCHRNFHRREMEGDYFHHHVLPSHRHHHHHYHHHQPHQPQFSNYYNLSGPHVSGYFVTPPLHQRPLALPSTSREDEDVSNPSSSGGGGVGGGSDGGRTATKKRFRTKFTPEQKEKLLAFSERLGWRIQKHDEAAVQQFCSENNVKRHVLKVWMHNNKNTLGKKS